MSKRVHEIAKERGLAPREVIDKLRDAGVNVKAASSTVDDATIAKVLGNGGRAPRGAAAKAQPASAGGNREPRSEQGDTQPAEGAAS